MSFFQLIKAYRHLWLVMTIGFTVILLGLAILGSQIISGVSHLESRTQELYTHPFKVNAAAQDASLVVAQIRIHTLELIAERNIAYSNLQITAILKDHNERLAEDLALIEANFLGDVSKVIEAKKIASEWHLKREGLYEILRQGKHDEAQRFLKYEVNPLYEALNQRLEYIRDFSTFKAKVLAEEAEIAASQSLSTFSYLITLLLLITVVAGGATLKVVLDQLLRRDNQVALEHERVEHMANYDELTKLPNRALFYDRLKQSLSLAKRSRSSLTLMFMDLDGFKKVNDSLGHHCGDLLLMRVAERLLGCVRESDTVGRIGGDEFTVILSDVVSHSDISVVASKIIQAISSPFYIEGHEVGIGVSIGIASGSEVIATVDDLLNNADMAMYESKKSGKNRYTFYSNTPRVNENEWIKFDVFHHIGISDLDEQHHELTRILNRINSATLNDMPNSEILTLFDGLIEETTGHFEVEERYMSHYGYPEQGAHTKEHTHLVNEAKKMRDRLSDSGEKLNLQAIRDWLLNHIKTSDKKMADYLLAHGAS